VIPQLTGEFVRRMLDVLEVYERPYDPKRPQVCTDEKSHALHCPARESLPPQPGRPLRKDPEYVRHGTANLFVTVEPQGGKRIVQVTKRRTARDFARHLQTISAAYPDADKIVLVLDNLNTHVKKSVIKTFGEAEGERLWSRFEIHYTPPHGSWLDMAEIEIGILSRQCLKSGRSAL
jgi:DDE superfamily endonuclease